MQKRFTKPNLIAGKAKGFLKKLKYYNKFVPTLRFVLPAKLADTGPPTGPMLGQYNVPLADFCQLF